jgi:AcrR family transcriptional regulator
VLYQHFPSKRALFMELLDDLGHQLLDELAVATGAAPTGRDRVEEGFAAYFRFVTGNEAAFRVLFGAPARNDAEFADIVERVLDETAEAISQLIEIEGTPAHRRVLAHALIGVAEATSRDALTDDGYRAEVARNGQLWIPGERLNIRNARYLDDPRPVQDDCPCLLCTRFSRAYLAHLFRAEELLAYRLATCHNLTFTLDFMARIRASLDAGSFPADMPGLAARAGRPVPGAVAEKSA